jgi:hypothetical protein
VFRLMSPVMVFAGGVLVYLAGKGVIGLHLLLPGVP